MLAAVDWTNVFVALIAGAPAIIAAIYSVRVNGQIKTPSKRSIGEQVESAHLTAIANNMQLTTMNGATQTADPDKLREQVTDPPQIPADKIGG